MNTTQVLTNIIAYTAQLGLLVGMGAALPVLLRLKAPGARLRYWQVLLIACLALPWLRPWRSEVIAVSGAPVVAAPVTAPLEAGVPVRSALPPVTEIALWLLAAGAALRLSWLAAGLLKLARYRRRGRAIPLPPEWTGAASHTSLLISEEINGPVTFGFFHPVVLLPAGFPAMPEAMRNAILFHELLHVERCDWLFTFGEELLRAVFWFHPAIWWVLGEIQLAREQTVDRAVIDMTQARDHYVDTLLAMAGVNSELDLAPAPLFLRRRHLKQRVMGIVQEVGMSKTRLIVVQSAALAVMALACWVVTGAIPLHAQAQMVADAPGVTVNLNGSELMHRTPVQYPVAALEKGVEGTVVVQVHLDANGEVTDDAILSGPDELRRVVQQSVLNWHFDRSEASSTRVINIDFVKPANTPVAAAPAVATSVQVVGTAPAPAASAAPPAPGALLAFAQSQLERLAAKQAQLREQQAAAGATPEQQAQVEQQMQANAALAQQLRQKLAELQSNGQPSQPQTEPTRTIENIVVTGLSDTARDELLAQLPVHAGDAWSQELASKAVQAARAFDEHLSARAAYLPDGNMELRITTQPAAAAAPPPPNFPVPPGALKVGGNVEAANLINPVRPVYPPLAKMARQQGTVKFQATIGKDGMVEDLVLISGPPLLVQAAMDAVKQWTYRPTMLNGAPVEVVTTIDVNFTLAENMPAAPAQ